MSATGRNSRSALLAPFQIRDFRRQFPADMLTSWGIEMEVLILGWYIVTETGSVLPGVAPYPATHILAMALALPMDRTLRRRRWLAMAPVRLVPRSGMKVQPQAARP